MKAKYRIYTEDLKRDIIVRLISNSFSGFTIIEATGYWNNEEEKTVIFEIVAEKSDLHLIEYICSRIKQTNNQEAVLFTVDYIDSILIR